MASFLHLDALFFEKNRIFTKRLSMSVEYKDFISLANFQRIEPHFFLYFKFGCSRVWMASRQETSSSPTT